MLGSLPFTLHRALALFVVLVLVGTTHASVTYNWREYSSSDSCQAGESVDTSFTLTSSSTPVSGQSTCLPVTQTDAVNLGGLTAQSVTMDCANLCSTSTTDTCNFAIYLSADCSGSAAATLTGIGTNSGQCLVETTDDEYLKNTMTVIGCTATKAFGTNQDYFWMYRHNFLDQV